MRSEKEIIDTVLGAADEDDHVRAVIRTDLLPKREFAYYNFYFIVDDIGKYDGRRGRRPRKRRSDRGGGFPRQT